MGNEYRGGGSWKAMLQSEVQGSLCGSHSYKTPVCVSSELLWPWSFKQLCAWLMKPMPAVSGLLIYSFSCHVKSQNPFEIRHLLWSCNKWNACFPRIPVWNCTKSKK